MQLIRKMLLRIGVLMITVYIRIHLDLQVLHKYSANAISRTWHHIKFSISPIKRVWLYIHGNRISSGYTHLCASVGTACVPLWVLPVCLCGYCLCASVGTACVPLWVLPVCLCGYCLCAPVGTACVPLWVLPVCLCG